MKDHAGGTALVGASQTTGKGDRSVSSTGSPRIGISVVAEALRLSGRARRPVFGSALLTSAGALLVAGGIVAGAFAVSWGLFLQARRDAEYSIASEDSYVAYADQWDSLVKVACVVFPLLLAVALVCGAWLLTAQSVTVALTREHAEGSAPAPVLVTLRTLWSRSRRHLGVALRVQALNLACALVPALAGLILLALIDMGLVPGVVWPTYHDPATVQFILVGRSLPVVIWALGYVMLGRFSLATAVRVTDNCSARAAMRRSWVLTRTARLRISAICLLSAAAVAVVFAVLKGLGTFVAHWAGLLMLATTDDNVWVTGVLVIITPVAVALVLLPFVLAPVGVLLACLHGQLADGDERDGDSASRTSSGSTRS
jgi:hypothetical protein